MGPDVLAASVPTLERMMRKETLLPRVLEHSVYAAQCGCLLVASEVPRNREGMFRVEERGGDVNVAHRRTRTPSSIAGLRGAFGGTC